METNPREAERTGFGLHGDYGNKPIRRLFTALRLWRAFNCIKDAICDREPEAAAGCLLLER
ncbi:hypothetical protein NKH85_24035 [Mesorhizobium sp. M0924]|uniref:hypothetical protein n=1 Tax=unclassified Mesorhizobium TaxID=325217 RepID=UPI0003CE3E41|nr:MULTISPECIES: hypothetical protein [unclassified Mesorhizobium]ESW89765.1 hypothetical protein X770_13865 [Mesorhizobium sp. LSJC269B00]ESX90155.1 hypothetical protein X756_05165 [Mesorhizobium sp. LSHC412B00]